MERTFKAATHQILIDMVSLAAILSNISKGAHNMIQGFVTLLSRDIILPYPEGNLQMIELAFGLDMR